MAETDSNAWRLGLAKQLAAVYSASTGVAALGVTGSVSRSRADAFSDIELLIMWHHAPSESERESLAEEVGGTSVRMFPHDSMGTAEWSEDFMVHGVKIDISHQTLRMLDQHVHDVVETFDTSLSKQHVLAAIQFALPLYEEAYFETMRQEFAHYPDGLKVAMIHEHCQFGPHQWVEMLASRGEIVALHDIFVRASHNLVSTLTAVNGMYHPGFKWLDSTISDMQVCPAHMSARLQAMFQAQPATATEELGRLIEETLALTKTTLPEMDTVPIWKRFRQTRTLWVSPPPNLHF